MKAIINITNKLNQYSKFNGLTFEVGEVGENFVSLVGENKEYLHNQTDFSFDEVLIVDVQEELKTVRTEREWKNLCSYTRVRNIRL